MHWIAEIYKPAGISLGTISSTSARRMRRIGFHKSLFLQFLVAHEKRSGGGPVSFGWHVPATPTTTIWNWSRSGAPIWRCCHPNLALATRSAPRPGDMAAPTWIYCWPAAPIRKSTTLGRSRAAPCESHPMKNDRESELERVFRAPPEYPSR